MKRLLLTLTLALALTLTSPLAHAQGGGEGTPIPQTITVTFEWDPMPPGEMWTEVRLYEILGESYILLATVAGSLTTATVAGLAAANHVFIIRSFDGRLESIDSNQAVMTMPSAPINFIITGGQ